MSDPIVNAEKAAQGVFARFVHTIKDNAKYVAIGALVLGALIAARVFGII